MRFCLTIVCVAVLASVLTGPPSANGQQGCSARKTCGQMRDCAEAYYFFKTCGHKRRDGDNDGIPCERICGKTLAMMKARIKASSGVGEPALAAGGRPGFKCAGKTRCRQMVSCAEAKFYLTRCGLKRIDGNRDGVPCSGLCRK